MSLITLTKAVGLSLAWTSSPDWSVVWTPAVKELFNLQDLWTDMEYMWWKLSTKLLIPWSGLHPSSSGMLVSELEEFGLWGSNDSLEWRCFLSKEVGKGIFFPWSFQLGKRPNGFYISSSLRLRQLIVPRKVWSIMSSLQPPPHNPQKLMGRWNSTASLKASFINTQVHFKAFTSLSENRFKLNYLSSEAWKVFW